MIMNKRFPGLLVTPADKEQALYSGLMGLGSQLAQGYTTQPSSFLQRLTQGGQAFQKAYGDKIATTKAEQLQNMQAQSAQAQLEAQMMKIAEAAKLKKLQEDREQAAMRYFGSQGQYSPNMMDASGIEQTMDTRNVSGSMPLSVYDKVRMNTGQSYDVLKDIDTRRQKEEEAIAKFERDLLLEKIKKQGSKGLNLEKIMQLERDLAKDVQTSLKPQIERVRNYRAIEAIYDDPATLEAAKNKFGGRVEIDGKVFQLTGQGAADMALIFAFMKMNDPGSVVRESEFDMAAETGGTTQAAVNFIGKVLKGDRLSSKERRKLLRQARNQFNAAKEEIDLRLQSETARFKEYDDPGLSAERALRSVYTPYTPRISADLLRRNITGRAGSITEDELPFDAVKVG